MAKAVLGRYAQKDVSFSRAIEACMKRKGLTGTTIAPKIHISFSAHYKKLKNPESFTLGELRAYIRTLDIPEEDVLDALYLDRKG